MNSASKFTGPLGLQGILWGRGAGGGGLESSDVWTSEGFGLWVSEFGISSFRELGFGG